MGQIFRNNAQRVGEGMLGDAERNTVFLLVFQVFRFIPFKTKIAAPGDPESLP
jgi:hypothetical protein